MNKFVALTMLCTLAACDPGLGVSRAGDTISRCGPQTQALP